MLRCLQTDNEYDIKQQKWYTINNEFIYGRFSLFVRGTTDSQLFMNNDLLSLFCFECKFKKDNIKYSDLQFGFSFKEAFKDIPNGIMIDLLKSCVEMIWPEFETFDVRSDTPTLISPMVLFCDRMHIENMLQPLSFFHVENTNVDFPTCRDKKSRRDFLINRADSMYFKKHKIYTFITHQNVLNLQNKKLSFGGINMDLSKHLGQPIPLCLMLKGEFLLNGQYLRNEKEAFDALEFQDFQSAKPAGLKSMSSTESEYKYEEGDLILF